MPTQEALLSAEKIHTEKMLLPLDEALKLFLVQNHWVELFYTLPGGLELKLEKKLVKGVGNLIVPYFRSLDRTDWNRLEFKPPVRTWS